MAQEPDVAQEHAESIQRRIEETRAALACNLGTLQRKLRGMVLGDAGPVGERLEAVKNIRDLKSQVVENPWLAVAGAVAAGWFIARLFSPATPAGATGPVDDRPPDPSPNHFRVGLPATESSTHGGAAPSVAEGAGTQPEPTRLEQQVHRFGPELQKIRGLAIGVGMEIAREMIHDSVAPDLSAPLDEILASVTVKLGGELIRGPILRRGTDRQGPP